MKVAVSVTIGLLGAVIGYQAGYVFGYGKAVDAAQCIWIDHAFDRRAPSCDRLGKIDPFLRLAQKGQFPLLDRAARYGWSARADLSEGR